MMISKQLLIEEMKRAIYLMENNEKLKTMKHITENGWNYMVVDREVSELRQLLLAIRKHSIMLEKGIN
jgi:hypothetical protein